MGSRRSTGNSVRSQMWGIRIMSRILPSQMIPNDVVTEGSSGPWKNMGSISTQPEPPPSHPNQAHGLRNVSQTKEEQAVELVIYEIWMLRSCCDKLKPPPQDKFIKNLLIENMVLHARVLRDFFFTKLNEKKSLSNEMTTFLPHATVPVGHIHRTTTQHISKPIKPVWTKPLHISVVTD
jgi:hypothetical protein